MTTTTTAAAKRERTAQIAEFVELALVKLGVDYAADPADLKIIGKKAPLVLAANISRLRAMADYDRVTPNAPEVGGILGVPAQRKASGNGARRAAAPQVSQAKLDYAASLLTEVWGEGEAVELIAELGQYDNDHISRMIDQLKLLIPISEGQVRFAKSLFTQKFGTKGAAEFAASLDQLTKAEAKSMLDTMQTLPDYVAPRTATEQAPARRNAPEVKADGMYRNPETGEIFKVQVAIHGSGNLYAKKMVKLDEPRIVRGKETFYSFEMARGAIMTLKPEWQLTRADATEFGKLYGCCMRCGTVLTDEQSIDDAIGPVCRGKFDN